MLGETVLTQKNHNNKNIGGNDRRGQVRGDSLSMIDLGGGKWNERTPPVNKKGLTT